MNKKIRILAIAPYSGMQTLITQIASQYPTIEMTVFVGDLEEGASIASCYDHTDYDIIISRGGTAELIRKASQLPVIEIPISVYDILRSIKLSENFTEKYALIGFPSITQNAQFICDILQYNIDIYTIHSEKEGAHTLSQLSNNGYKMILCDMITNSLAQEYGLTSILITSGSESIQEAINRAIQTAEDYEKLNRKLQLEHAILSTAPFHILVYNEHNEILYESAPFPYNPDFLKTLTSKNITLKEEKETTFVIEDTNKLLTVHGKYHYVNNSIYIPKANFPTILLLLSIAHNYKESHGSIFLNTTPPPFGIQTKPSTSD